MLIYIIVRARSCVNCLRCTIIVSTRHIVTTLLLIALYSFDNSDVRQHGVCNLECKSKEEKEALPYNDLIKTGIGR